MKKSLFILMALSLAAGVCLAGGPVALKTPSPFSVQMHSLTGDFATHKRTVNLISAAGIRQVRDECFWHLVEKAKGVYKIPEHCLRNLNYSIKKGLDTLIILDYTNDLYDDGMAPTSPEAVRAFGEYCFTMAHQLKGKVHYFEVWNEPNIDGFWKPKADPVAYRRLLKVAYRRIKQGNPDALVCGVCLAGLDEKFLWSMMDNGGYDFMDVVSLHPYCPPKTPEDAEIFEKMDTIHEHFAKYGKVKKDIWLTEIGWPTNIGGGVSEYEQAVCLARTYLNALTVPYIPTVFTYWFGPDGPDAQWAEHRFGLIHQDWSPKPSYTVYKNIVKFCKSARFEKFLMRDEYGTRLLYFKNKVSGENIYALWGLKDYVDVVANSTEPVEVVGLTGESETITPYKNTLNLRIGQMPVLILSKESLRWNVKAKPQIELKFTRESNKIPRGQSRTFLLGLPAELKGGSVKFRSPNRNWLTFEQTPGGCLARASTKSPTKMLHFSALVTSPDAEKPSTYAQGEVCITKPASVYVSPLPPSDNRKTFLVSITNLSLNEISGTVTLTPPEGVKLDKDRFRLPPIGINTVHTERVNIMSQHPPDEIFTIKADVKLNSGVSISFEKLIDFYECVRALKPPVLDGDLSDWPKDAQVVRLGSKKQYVSGYVEWDGLEDSSARVYTAWDSNWFYIGIELQDDKLSSPCAGFSVYNNDGVELYFDIDHEGDRNEARYSDDDYQYGMLLEHAKAIVYSWSQLKDYSKTSRIALNLNPKPSQTLSGRTFKGMIMEGAIPMKELKLKPRDGLLIGFCTAYTDDDDPRSVNPFSQEIQMTWTCKRNAWQNPQVFGDLFFVDRTKKGRISIKGRHAFIDGSFFFRWASGRSAGMKTASAN